jgi:dipeptidyl aminopeptidase/acylaminoacyl peptidase
VRGWDERVLVELERADITGLRAAGWTAPERFRVADGIYGVLYLPHGFDPSRRYPVIDHVYPSPATTRVSPTFDPGWHGYDAEAVAALGFVVIAVDGHGTPGRDRAFHDASLDLADHVTALRELAATRPWMDLDRVGVFGISAGGAAAVRAMLEFPGVFHVGVAESGNHDNHYYNAGWGETYGIESTVDIADRLAGKLLLVHGGMDNNVLPDHALRLADRLIAADKDFDLLIVPEADHVYLGYEHYVTRRKWDFLVRWLIGAEPPAYRLSPVPMDMAAIAELLG